VSSPDLFSLLPRDKFDVENAGRLVALGYPATEPVIPQLLEWLQDMNWPVAQVLQPFLAGIGLPLANDIRRVIADDDHIWSYWVLSEVVALSGDLVIALRPELETLASIDPVDEDARNVRDTATQLLASSGSIM